MQPSVWVESDRLFLRELTPADVPALQEAIADPVARRFYVNADRAGGGMEAYVAEAMANTAAVPRSMYQLGVVRHDSGELIGRGYLSMSGALGVPELGSVISSRHRGQNFGTETVRLLIRLAFERLDLDAVWATCRADNIASQRVIERVGMRFVRRIKDRIQPTGEPADSLLYVAERGPRGTTGEGWRTPSNETLPSPRFEACRCLRPTCPCPVARHYALEVRAVLRALRQAL